MLIKRMVEIMMISKSISQMKREWKKGTKNLKSRKNQGEMLLITKKAKLEAQKRENGIRLRTETKGRERKRIRNLKRRKVRRKRSQKGTSDKSTSYT